MALEAEEGLPRVEQPIVDRAVRVVAGGAVLADIAMFIKEWASLVGMTLDTGFLDRVLKQARFGESSVRIVTVYAKYPTLFEGMMAWQGKLRLGGLMAGNAKFARSPGGDFQVRTGMYIVAIKAGDFVDGMDSGVPVMQVERGIGSVAFEADERLRRARKVL